MERRGPLFITPWRSTFACDNSCLHCASAGKSPFLDEVNTSNALQVVNQIYDFGASWLGITGGDPLRRNDIFEIVRYARKIGLNVSMISDGRLMSETVLQNIVKNEIRVSISIDGAEANNDLIRGNGAYSDALFAIKRLSSENLLNCLVYTFANISNSATNVNVKDTTHVLDLATEYNARWVIFHSFIPYSTREETLRASPSPQQYEWIFNKLFDLNSKYKGKPEINVYCPFFARIAKQRGLSDFDNWYNHFFLGRCFFGRFMSIAENGDVIPCSYNDTHRFGNVLTRDLKEIWNEMQTSEFLSGIRDKNSLKGKCSVCEYKELCGGCRTAAEFFTGDVLGSDLRCAYIPKSMRE